MVGAACSFSGETLVLMANGSKRRISRVRVGDRVVATDPLTGRRTPRKVTRVWVHQDQIVRLTVNGDLIATTKDHPFWDATERAWKPAERLDAGDQVLSADGRYARVGGLINYGSSPERPAYNLTVEGVHTYHVGRLALLVHNVCNPNRMRQEVIRGQAPRGIKRVDKADDSIPGHQPHITFSDKLPTLNLDGTWGHLGRGPIPQVTRNQRAWLRKNEWTLPD